METFNKSKSFLFTGEVSIDLFLSEVSKLSGPYTPLKTTFKIIAMVIRQQFFMLKSSYDNTRRNSYFLGKVLNTHLCAIRILRYKLSPFGAIYQYI
jgi:hypothetical protein